MVVGASTGGFRALQTLLAGLPARFRTPVAVVLHRLPGKSDSIGAALQPVSALRILEPDDKTRVEAGHVYVAPADYHLLVERGRFALSTEERVMHARPSVDVLFESAAVAYGAELIGVVLTGASEDGAAGAAAIRARGGTVVVQDPKEAESGVMPRAAADAGRGRADVILPLARIAGYLVQACGKEERRRG